MSKRKLTLNRFTELCKDGLAYLYCIKLCNEQETFYKVGVTSRENIFSRLSSIPYDCELIRAYSHPSSVFIFDLEKKLLKLGTKYRPLIEFGGSSECISEIDPVLDYLESLNWISELLVVTNKKQKTIKGNFASIASQYVKTLIKLQDKKILPQEIVDSSEEFKNTIESDSRFEVIVEYIKLFGADAELVQGCSRKMAVDYLSKKIESHKEKVRLKELLSYKYTADQVLSNSSLKEDLTSIYYTLNLTGTPKLTDINLSFESITTSYKEDGKKINAVKLIKKL